MKRSNRFIFLFFLIFSFNVFSNGAKSLEYSYQIKYLGEPNASCLDVSVHIPGNAEGRVKFHLPKYMTSLSMEIARGKISYTIPEPNIYEIKLEPNLDLKVKYRACMNNHIRNISHPIIEKDFIYFNSGALLAFPVEDLYHKMKANFSLINFPTEFTLLNNNGLNINAYEIEDTIKNIVLHVIAAGNFHVKTLNINKRPVTILVKDTWHKYFTYDELESYLKLIIKKQRDFFKDNNFPFFALVLFKTFEEKSTVAISGRFHGNVLGMSISDSDPKYKPVFYGTLSHELLHAWFGSKIDFPRVEAEFQWFFEGLNDFYGWQLALETDEVSNQIFHKYHNILLREYVLSPFKENSNEDLVKYYSFKNPADQLLLARGHIVYLEILNELYAQGKSRKYIDKAMREIFHKYGNRKKDPTMNDLTSIFRKHIGAEIWDKYFKSIQDGHKVSFSLKPFYDNVILQDELCEVANYGFDLDKTLRSKQIFSLQKGSAAELAGLKENDKIDSYNISMMSPNSPAYFIIQDAHEKKLIQFNPKIEKVNIPQYVPAQTG